MKKNYQIISLLTASITGLHLLNRLLFSLSKKREVLQGSEYDTYDWRLGSIKYEKKGSGTPLLLLHDLDIGSSSYEFKKLSTLLAKHHKVYTLDLLGFGLSDKQDFTYTNFLYAQLVTDFIHHVIGCETTIISSGDACTIGIMTCQTSPDLVKDLILISPRDIHAYERIPSKRSKMCKYILEMPIIGTFVYNLLSSKENIEAAFATRYYSDFTACKQEEIYAYMEAAHTKDCNAKYAYASAVGRYTNVDIFEPLREINHNIMLILGDDIKNVEALEDDYLACNGAMESYRIEGTKKLPHLEKPEEVARKCLLFS